MLYVASPLLTDADGNRGASFVRGLVDTIGERDAELLHSELDLAVTPGPDDLVVVLNPVPGRRRFRTGVEAFLRRCRASNSEIVAVALEDSNRLCPEPLEGAVAYPVHDVIATYRFTPSQTYEVGRVFARTIRSRLHPTYALDQLQVFLSYRQLDGQDVARGVREAVRQIGHDAYRDLADLSNDAVDDRIRRALDECDVLVLLDTPAVAESPWIRLELCIALSTGIPIVWVRLNQTGPSVLPVRPADQPDIVCMTMPASDKELHDLAVRILDAAFTRSTTHVGRAENFLRRVRTTVGNVDTVDDRRRVFKISRPRSVRHHRARPETHIVQLFGRRPNASDRTAFKTLLARDWHGPGGEPQFDISAMLTPTLSSTLADDDSPPQVMDTSAYARTVLDPDWRKNLTTPSPELLLFASFAGASSQGQEVRNAVREIAAFWLSRAGRVRFGGHPTVTPTINYIAHAVAPGSELDLVTMFQSRYFVTKPLLLEYARWATIVDTDATGDRPEDRIPSLTVMREAMILASYAKAAVVIGGLTPDDLAAQGRTEMPGVEEEMMLARQRGIPVFLLGATGGHAAILADRARSADSPWSSLGNRLSDDLNDDLARTDDYEWAAETIWRAAVE